MCFLYTKIFKRQGIAQALFDRLLYEIKSIETKTVTADVSITAKAFFESNGFIVIREQIQIRNNVEIMNYKMELAL